MHQTSLRFPSLFLFWGPLVGLLACLQGYASLPRSIPNPPQSATLAITTTSLPSGQINVAYSATLAATGGTTPYTWSLTSGTLPTGLTLNASTGEIGGTPTVSVTSTPLTFQVQDSGSPLQTKTVNLTLTIASNFAYVTGSVSGVYNASGTTSTTLSVPLHQTPGAGHLLVCAATWQSPTATATMSDPNNGTWTAIGAAKAGVGSLSGHQGQMFYVPSAVSASTTVTLTISSAVAFRAFECAEYSYTGTIATLDGAPQYSAIPSSGGVATVSGVTTSNSSDLVFADCLGVDTTCKAGSGYTGLNDANTFDAGSGRFGTNFWGLTGQLIEYKVGVAAGAQSATFGTGTASENVILGLVALTAPAQTAPAITSANNTTFAMGTAGSFTVTTTGAPTPTLAETGALPSGVAFKDNGNGTGTLSGTPATGSGGAYVLTLTASNGVGSPASQSFTLTVNGGGGGSSNFAYVTSSVSGVYNAGQTTGTTLSVPLHQTPGAGHLLVCAATWQSPTATATMSDPNNGTWAAIGNAKTGVGSLSGYQGQMFYVPSAVSASTTVTMTISSAVAFRAFECAEYSYTGTIATLDGVPQYSTTAASGGVATVSGVATSNSSDLVFADCLGVDTTCAAGSGYTGLNDANTFDAGSGRFGANFWGLTGQLIEYKAGAAAGAQSATFGTGTPTNNVILGLVALTGPASQTPPPTLAITTTSLPSGQVNVAYSTSLAATGGTTPYTWSLTSGTLPTGLTLNASTGAITGTPTVSVTSTPLTFQVKDSGSPQQTTTVNLTLTIAPATLAITTTSLPSGQVNVAYSATLAATGGTTPYTWSLTSGTLPTGLTLNASTGAITGTPTVSVTSTPLTFQVKDSSSPQQTKTVNLTLTIAPATLAITTTSLPSGQANVAYSATLAATGGTTPFTWSLTSGTLPTGLTLNASTGAITGTPTVSVTSTPLTFQVKDSGSPQQTKTVNLTLTIGSGSTISVSISPKRAGVTVNQLLSLTATVSNDSGSAGVNWSVSAGGGLSLQTNSSASFSAATAGVYTVTATSNTDGSKTASLTVGVTDLTGVTTYHNNLSRDGTNPQEYALTTATVTTTTFGKLFACTIDSPAYAQPLWVANLSIGGGVHNVVFVASSHDTIYAFDADQSPCVTYWSVSLLGSGETYLSSGDVSSVDIEPDIGIVGTPVIDLTSSTLYVVSKSKDSGTSCTPSSSCHQRLHALNLADHAEKFGGPYDLTPSITVPGNADGSINGQVPFDPLRQNQRPGLALVNGVVYITWGSHGDRGPYHGWVMGFAANNIGAGPSAVWNSTPSAVSGSSSYGGIWMSGAAPAVDSSNNLYFPTGNGAFNVDSGGSDYGDSMVKLSTSGSLHVTDYFAPYNQSSLNSGDLDLGSGGATILADQPSGPVQHLLISGSKPGVLFLFNRDNMGHFNTSSNNVVQSLNIGRAIFATAAFWNNSLYIVGVNNPVNQFTFNTGTGQFSSSPTHTSACCYYHPGSTPSVSSLGSSTAGIVWALDNSQYCTSSSPGCGPTVLHAYDATNVSIELWNSTRGSGNSAGNAVKFTVPTVANGKVYVPTRSELDVYGLLPN